MFIRKKEIKSTHNRGEGGRHLLRKEGERETWGLGFKKGKTVIPHRKRGGDGTSQRKKRAAYHKASEKNHIAWGGGASRRKGV